MRIRIDTNRKMGITDARVYGQFVEHFHRQVYGGIYDPDSPLSDEEGFRKDVMEALREIKASVMRWPGGCFASVYHWKDGVGKERKPFFDKAWRVEESNAFGTDEFIRFCQKVECEPYICTNAGTGTSEEMSDWVEYCNEASRGSNAKARIKNGSRDPYQQPNTTIGNQNYDPFEMGSKGVAEWGRFVLESAKMMKSVDPSIELSAAALDDMDWNIELLKMAGEYLDWISLHAYWDQIHLTNDYASYEQSVAYTESIESMISRVRGLLLMFGLTDKIKVAFDEWNLRGWYHPGIHCKHAAVDEKDYLFPRDLNDENCRYTMADAVFSACFLNSCNRNNDIVKMANMAPAVNARGCIYTWEKGIVKRSTWYVFDLFVNYFGRQIIDSYVEENPVIEIRDKEQKTMAVRQADVVASLYQNGTAVSVINKSSDKNLPCEIVWDPENGLTEFRVVTVNGASTESFNDIDHEGVGLTCGEWKKCSGNSARVLLEPHSVNMIQIRQKRY